MDNLNVRFNLRIESLVIERGIFKRLGDVSSVSISELRVLLLRVQGDGSEWVFDVLFQSQN